MEADLRHAEIVNRELGLKAAKATRVPGAKEAKRPEHHRDGEWEEGTPEGDVGDHQPTEPSGDEEDEDLEPSEATRYRAIAARLGYLAIDRLDLQFAVKEAARAMSRPKDAHFRMLNRIGRYIVGAPRLITRFPRQAQQFSLTTFADSDWAGCLRTARSTCGGILMMGEHMLKSSTASRRWWLCRVPKPHSTPW